MQTHLTNSIDILIFKTNLRFKKDIKKISSFFECEPRILLWNVDLEDADMVLRIEAKDIKSKEIIKIFKEAGYFCEELPD